MVEDTQQDDELGAEAHTASRSASIRRSATRLRHRLDRTRRRYPALLPSLAVVVLWMAVDVIPAVSNDGVVYLTHSESLISVGLIDRGWRMIGYPLFLRSVTSTAPLLGLDGLFAVVLIQRLLVLAFGLITVKLFRWWGVALFGMLFSIGTMVYVDFVLAEGLALPLAALAGLAFGAWWIGRSRLVVAGSALFAIVLFMSLVRFQYVVLWVAPLLVLVALWFEADRTAFRRFGAAFTITLGLVAVFYVGVMNENYHENGVRAPVANDGNLSYYAAWSTLFVVEEIPLSSDELMAFYDEGSPWPRMRELRAIQPFSTRSDLYEVLNSRLIAASGLSLAELRLRAFAGALIGGRFDDMTSIKPLVTADDLSVRLSTTLRSGNVREIGEETFLDRYNDGREPASLVTSPAVWFVPELPRWVVGFLWVGLLAIALIPGLAIRWQYAYIAAALAPHVLVSAAAASIIGDSSRWLLPTLVFSVVALYVVVMVRIEGWTARSAASSVDGGDLRSAA